MLPFRRETVMKAGSVGGDNVSLVCHIKHDRMCVESLLGKEAKTWAGSYSTVPKF